MTQNEVNIIKNSVLDATEAYVDARLSVADFVKTQIGVTQGTPTYSGGKYYHTVLCNATSGTSGITYNNVLSVGNIEFPNNSVVFLIAPNAQFTNQFILGKLDDTPCNIVGGSIKIGKIGSTNNYYFTVDSTGNLNINNKFNVDNTGNINVNDKFKVDNTGNLFVGGLDTSTAKFYVTNTGQVTMKSGSINIKDKFYVDSDGNLFVGGTATSTAKFYVTNTGQVTMKSGSINIKDKFYVDSSGNLFVGGTTTTNSNFYVTSSGSLSAKDGYIGGFNITSSSLGDPMGSNQAIGMIGHSYLYAWDSSSHIYMYPHKLELDNARIDLDYGSSWIHINSQQIESGDKGYVVWHSEVDSSGLVTGSDKRIKKDINNISNNKIRIFFDNIEPVSFKFKDDNKFDDKPHYGIIAQNVKGALKKANLTDKGIIKKQNNTLMVYYQEFHGLELAGIKDLYNIVKDQQEQIDVLKALINKG